MVILNACYVTYSGDPDDAAEDHFLDIPFLMGILLNPLIGYYVEKYLKE
jgi:hypothetical protein